MSMRHNCETGGCFIKVGTVDWGFLDNSFSGKIRIGDIDGIVEANGHLLILEWKKPNVKTPTGQHIMFSKITQKNNIEVFVINGDPVENTAEHIKVYRGGKIEYDGSINNSQLKQACYRWEQNARLQNNYSKVA